MKICYKCKAEKPTDQFYENKRMKDGLDSYCKLCRKEYTKLYQKTYGYDKSKKKERHKRWLDKNPNYQKDYYHSRYKDYHQKYYQVNKKRYRSHTAKRRALKHLATPEWLDEQQKVQIESFYERCPKDMQVDHIVPLRSNKVCGLHVPWNLQYLTQTENIRKGNRWWPNMWEYTDESSQE